MENYIAQLQLLCNAKYMDCFFNPHCTIQYMPANSLPALGNGLQLSLTDEVTLQLYSMYQNIHSFFSASRYYTDREYSCATPPTCSDRRACGSPYLFCDEDTGVCLPRLRQGARCDDFGVNCGKSNINPTTFVYTLFILPLKKKKY